MSQMAGLIDPSTLPALPDADASPAKMFGGSQRPQNGIPQFEIRSELWADGRYHEVEYVKILIPGDAKNIPEHRVTEALKELYRPWYDHWRKGLVMAPSGSPLEMWPLMTRSQVNHLKTLNIFTVEQLAGVADSLLNQIPMGLTMRNQAKAWLEEKAATQDVEDRRRHEEFLKDSIRLMEETSAKAMAQMQAQMQAQAAELAELKAQRMTSAPVAAPQLPPEAKRGPGRPPRIAAEQTA